MKKRFKFYAVIWSVLLIVFNIIVFVTPKRIIGNTKYTNAFWIGYLFITLAFIGQLICAYTAFQSKSKKSFFLRIPLITQSYAAMYSMISLGTIIMVTPFFPYWLGIVTSVMLLGFSTISILRVKLAADIIEDIDEKIKVQTYFIRDLTLNLDGLVMRAKSESTKAEVKKAYETVRYSDPMSNELLYDIEAQITAEYNKLLQAVEKNENDNVKYIVEEMIILVGDRNRKIKLLK